MDRSQDLQRCRAAQLRLPSIRDTNGCSTRMAIRIQPMRPRWSTIPGLIASTGCYLDFEPDLQSLRAAGILPVFAAGNSGPFANTSYSPSNNPSAFAVGAINNNSQIYGYSSRGPTTCGGSSGPFPEIVAPGVNVNTTDLYNNYYAASGTSLAAPHVAGGLALLLSAYPNLTAVDQEQRAHQLCRGFRRLGPDNSMDTAGLTFLPHSNGSQPLRLKPRCLFLPLHWNPLQQKLQRLYLLSHRHQAQLILQQICPSLHRHQFRQTPQLHYRLSLPHHFQRAQQHHCRLLHSHRFQRIHQQLYQLSHPHQFQRIPNRTPTWTLTSTRTLTPQQTYELLQGHQLRCLNLSIWVIWIEHQCSPQLQLGGQPSPFTFIMPVNCHFPA